MGWTEKRIKEIQAGQKPTKLEKIALEHGNPVHFTLATIALVVLIYGSWTRSLMFIIISIVLGILGHVYCWVQK